MSVLIDSVIEGSCAYLAGIRGGDTLVSLNSNEIVDVLDYRFYQLEREIKIEYISSGEVKVANVRKTEYEELGLEFSTYLMDKEHSCRNKCIFCFIDQMPKGMRDTLNFKDDDSRLSFLFGNYITLTNLTDHEIERVIKMHISPINISVHTTNPELRCKMMNNRFAGESLGIMKRFADAGIVINCQLVICPGINDGEELERSLRDLTELQVNSVAVVPVGLTDHREGLYPLTPFTKETANEVVNICEKFGDECVEKFGRRIIFAADELYIKAQRELPNADFYEDFSCLENGVGLISLLEDEFLFSLEQTEGDRTLTRQKTIACGESAAPFLKQLCEKLSEKFPKVCVNVRPIVNDFFGHMINVTGLIVGRDLTAQLKGTDLGEEVLISSSMLRSGEEVFLDDMTLDEAKEILRVPVTPCDNSGEDLLRKLLK
ncbi:MAG: DUF512 domain-containing protein [Eubacteriales bacterium]|nr:DUF512 domain-containing protein [Eubacteriales bacterium]